MARLILSLDDPAAREAPVVGSKAAALATMRQAGLPVPEGFAVSTGAFADAITDLFPAIEERLDEQIARMDGQRPAPAPGDVDTDAALHELLGRLAVPPALRAEVAGAYEALGDNVPVAVRSSATAEDLPGASFAGQYDSYLNVVGTESVLERLLAVWASLYSPHAVAYRARQGMAHAAARMAVLVQRQLPAEAAGVLFTRDPVTGADDRLLINSTFGLGEGVVSGELAVDAFALDRDSLAVVDRAVAEKEQMLAPQPGGGVERRAVPAGRRREPAMSDGQLAELGRLAQSVQRLFDGHRDIEFAVVDGSISLLQARPVTGLDQPPDEGRGEFTVEWDDPADAEYAWALAPGPPEPLRRFEEEVQDAYQAGARRVFEDTGAMQARTHLLRRVHGFPFARAPSVTDAEVEERQRRQRERDRRYRERGTSLYEVEIHPPAEDAFARLNRFRALRRASLRELFDHLEAALQAYGHVMGDLHWRMVGGMRIDWPSVYREITGEPEVDSGVLVQAIDNRTTQLVRRLRGMARVVQSDAGLRAVFHARSYDGIVQPPFRDRPAVRRFRDRLRRLLRDYGTHTGRGFGSSTRFTDPTWNMHPAAPLDLIAAYADQDIDDLERLEQAARGERRRATRRVRRALAADAEQLARFNESLPLAVEHVQRMENHNYLMEQGVTGCLREAIYLIGVALARAGRIDDPGHALHLALDELRTAVADDGFDVRALVRERRAEFERRSRMRPPRVIGTGEPPIPDMGAAAFDAPPADAGRDGTLLRGVAASRGRHTGRARVYTSGGERPEVQRGDILVAPNVGPDWTPLIPLLGGIVLDQGAVFQHAALVAREYRVPAVLMTREGTTVIADGQLIAIDGDEGVVDLAPGQDG